MTKSSRDRRVFVRKFKRESFYNFTNSKIKKIGIFGDITLEIERTPKKIWSTLMNQTAINENRTGKDWLIEVDGIYSV